MSRNRSTNFNYGRDNFIAMAQPPFIGQRATVMSIRPSAYSSEVLILTRKTKSAVRLYFTPPIAIGAAIRR